MAEGAFRPPSEIGGGTAPRRRPGAPSPTKTEGAIWFTEGHCVSQTTAAATAAWFGEPPGRPAGQWPQPARAYKGPAAALMIAHVVLFRPRADLSPAARTALAGAFEAALRDIPSIRRAHVGRRFLHGRAYETQMQVDYQYAAVLEFDDAAGLQAYLEHPAHQQLASQFFETVEKTLIYDFDLTEGEAGLAALLP